MSSHVLDHLQAIAMGDSDSDLPEDQHVCHAYTAEHKMLHMSFILHCCGGPMHSGLKTFDCPGHCS